ncbi:Fic family protein [Ectothiorhodospira variabilis]|uniref:Fic family protein n=1 Tax=Ectothiorhodospira variabilis TaxID=505694 RepID=UPI001EFA4261|nr:Fic family protein [Ectothiorhodospira variabilis]MCG5493569.1 Fic family protein [Ectothiorhodospira variabilis]MCG5502898.1 Fic family protein [Ectothiorhodospira variabilis]MCG5506314.1 Fic family protein [Ectothiorhodospira variabilis]
MTDQAPKWIWQHPDWPCFTWEVAEVQPRLQKCWRGLGILLGRSEALLPADDPEAEARAALDTLLENIVTSSAIEGERLNVASVRSSLARRLGVQEPGGSPSPRSEGLAELMLDATLKPDSPLDAERLFQWHRWLFPDAEASLTTLRPGQWRGVEPMQVVSGRIDRPKVHFEAPPRERLEREVDQFLQWFESSRHDPGMDPLVRAGLSHFWFVTLHPFEDGNGRIARAIADRALAQADQQGIRLYAMSAAILERRADYYRHLEESQRGTPDLTAWLVWFLDTLDATLLNVLDQAERTLAKARFWQRFGTAGLLPEQAKVLNRLLDGGERGFEQGISASQYQKVAKVSKATATRHLAGLVEKGCLVKLSAGGRSTRYQVPELCRKWIHS